MAPNTPPTQVDLRGIARESRPGRVQELLLALDAGGSAELIDDSDPNPLLLRLQRELPARFAWDAREVGAGVWQARLSRAAAAHGEGRCCGACGGH
jgi:uncharacterized protein (DUF2249 family)